MMYRSALLKLLIDNKGGYVSGEEAASKLNCTRTTVWNIIRQLKEEGYMIDAVRNKGYSLSAQSDVLSCEAISACLPDNFNVSVLRETESTNDALKELFHRENSPEGTAVISDCQTRGKGRLGRRFFSPAGTGLYLSLLLRPKGSVVENLMLTAQTAVAVHRAVLKVLGIRLDIKWVNDLYLNSRKVCGILTEGQTSLENGSFDFIIIGIGLNIYEPEEGFPEEISGSAGSLLGKRSAGGFIDRNLLAAEILKESYELSTNKILQPEYIKYNIVPGNSIVIIEGNRERAAKAIGILPNGSLEVEEADGRRHPLMFGEVSLKL